MILSARCEIEDFTYFTRLKDEAAVVKEENGTEPSTEDASQPTTTLQVPFAAVTVPVQSATTVTALDGGQIVSSTHDATGLIIWPATHLLCQYILLQQQQPVYQKSNRSGNRLRNATEEEEEENDDNWIEDEEENIVIAQKCVVELGCGCGLVGVAVAAASGRLQQYDQDRPKLWVSTDMDAAALEQCRKNYRLNGLDVCCDNNTESGIIMVEPLQWANQYHIHALLSKLRHFCSSTGSPPPSSADPVDGEAISQEKSPPGCNDDDKAAAAAAAVRFDVVVAADIVYPATCGQALRDLFETVDALLIDRGTFYLSFCSRDGPHTPRHLLESASAAGFRLTAANPQTWLPVSIQDRLPPMLGATILLFQRHAKAASLNAKFVGADDSLIFPGLWSTIERLRLAESDPVEEWDAPFDETVPSESEHDL